MSRHEYYHVFARISGTVVARHATNEIGLEIRLSDHGHALYELIISSKHKEQEKKENTKGREREGSYTRIIYYNCTLIYIHK